jgi:predicted ATPase
MPSLPTEETKTSIRNEIVDPSIAQRLSILQSRKCRTQSIDETLVTQAPSQAETNLLTKSAPFHKFVLTGGPCGGKTTALARLSSYLRERGFEVITVPEAFTILASNGFDMSYFAVEGMPFCVQSSVMDMQMALEDSFERVLRAKGKPGVLLCDRGLCDGSAYMTSDEWEKFLMRRGVTLAEIREGRYNAVFHLVTAAEGAEEFYTLENNDVRTETPEQARAVDVKTRGAWVGHPKLIVIDNQTDFEGKLNKLVNIASELVGLPLTSKQVTTKYVLKEIPNVNEFPKDVQYHLFQVEKVYLYDTETSIPTATNHTNNTTDFAEEYSFIRKRTHLIRRDGNGKADEFLSGGTTYGLTTVHVTHSGKRIEVKRIITQREYNAAYKTRDLNRHVVKQNRISFIWNMQSFNVHIYMEPVHVKDLCVVHVQQQQQQQSMDRDENNTQVVHTVEMPSFLKVDRKLEDSKQDNNLYGAFSISLCNHGS